MGLNVKAWLQKKGGDNSESEVRLFKVEPAEIENYAAFASKISQVFPALSGKIFNIYWKDDENDEVSISTNQELADALACVTSGVFRVTVKPRDGGNAKLHPNVICDGCETGVRGTRYKCCQCPDYDLCEECESKGVHPMHDMIAVRHPGSDGCPTSQGVSLLLPLLRANRVFKPHGGRGRRCGSNTRHCSKGPNGMKATCMPNGPHGPFGPQEDHQGCNVPWGPHDRHGPHGFCGPHGSHGPLGPHGSHGPHGHYGPHNPHEPHGFCGPHGSLGPHGSHGPYGPHGPYGFHNPHGPWGTNGSQEPHGFWGLDLPLGLLGSRDGLLGSSLPHGPHGPCEPRDRHGPHGPRRRCCKKTNDETKEEGERSDKKKNEDKAAPSKTDNSDTSEEEVEPEEFLKLLGETVAFNLESLGVLFGIDLEELKNGQCCQEQPRSGQSAERDGKPGTGQKSGQAPGAGQKTGQAPGDGQKSGQAPGAGQKSGQAPGTGQKSSQAPGAGQKSGQSPGAGQKSGQTPGAGQKSGQARGTGQKSGQSPGKTQHEQDISTDQDDVQLKEAQVPESRNIPSLNDFVVRCPATDGANVSSTSDRTGTNVMNTTSHNSGDQSWTFIGHQGARPKTSKSEETSEDKTQTSEDKTRSSHKHADSTIANALAQMAAMGFRDEGGWLTRLLEAKHGNISSVLDVIKPHKPE